MSKVPFAREKPMEWEPPEFLEIRMDAEINYMDDLDRDDSSHVED